MRALARSVVAARARAPLDDIPQLSGWGLLARMLLALVVVVFTVPIHAAVSAYQALSRVRTWLK